LLSGIESSFSLHPEGLSEVLATSPNEQTNWYAVRVKANREYVTNASLEGKGYETCLPMYSAKPNAAQKPKALFPGYVFARFDCLRRLPVLTSPGVVNIVSVGARPAPLADEEVASIQAMIGSKQPVYPWPYLNEGQKVRVVRGSLTGVQGIVTQLPRGWMVVASVILLQRSVAIQVDRSWIEPV
jgi:transcription antitermination factor NusG